MSQWQQQQWPQQAAQQAQAQQGQQGWGQQQQQPQQQQWAQQQQQQQQPQWSQQQQPQQQQVVPPSGKGAAPQAHGGASRITVSGCQNETVAQIINGVFESHDTNHDKPVYKKQGGDPSVSVLIYFWDARDGPNFCGWWFGPRVGGDQVWAYNPSEQAATPPSSDWKVPWDGPVDGSLVLQQGQAQQQAQQQQQQPQQQQASQGWGQQQQAQPNGAGPRVVPGKGQAQQYAQQNQASGKGGGGGGWEQQQQQQQQQGKGGGGWEQQKGKGGGGGWEQQQGKGDGWRQPQQGKGQQQQQQQPWAQEKSEEEKAQEAKQTAAREQHMANMAKKAEELKEAMAKKAEEQKAKQAEIERIKKQKEEEMQKRQEELKKKREEEETRRNEQAAALQVRKVIQRIRIANPENYDDLRSELEKMLEEQLEKMGSQAEKVQQEAEKALLQAQERVDQITQKKLDDERKAEEEAQKKKEEVEKVERLSKEATTEVEDAETKVAEGIESVKIESDSPPESILEAVEKTDEVAIEMHKLMDAVSSSLGEKRKELGDCKLGINALKSEFGPHFRKLAVLRRKVVSMKDSAKISKDLANKKNKAIKKEKAIKDLFKKYAKNKDGKMRKAEVAAYSKGKFDFELKGEALDKVVRQLAKDETGVSFEKFARLKVMVAIARSEVRARIRRAEEAEKERLKKEAEEKKQAALAEKKAAIEKAFSDAVDSLKSAEDLSRKAEGITAKVDDTLRSADDLSSSELSEAATTARDAATEGRGKLAEAKEKLEKVEADDDDEDMKSYISKQETSLKRRISQVESQLERVDTAVKTAEEKAARKAYVELDALKTSTVTALRIVMSNDSIGGDDLFSRISGGKSEIGCEKFATFVRSLPELTFKDEQAEKLFSHVTEGEDELSKDKFLELIRLFYKVIKASVLTEEVGIKSKTLRRLDLAEVVEALDAPKKDEDLGMTRMRCKAISDGQEGFVTISGNQGTVFLQPGGSTYKCIKDTFITAGLSVADSKNVRKIRLGEIADVLEFPTMDESCNVKRIKVKAKSDGATGWVTIAGNQGTPFMEAC